MKLIYSHLKTFLPDLNVEPQILRDDLTMIGHFTNFYEIIEDEVVFDLDIKVNRGDCLGYYGLARDLSVYYNIPLVLPTSNVTARSLATKQSLPLPPIEIKSPDVKRIQAIKLTAVKNSTSPDWLVRFLRLHGINPINTLVDLTNYIMLWWGIPNHTFDASKFAKLVWENHTSPPTDFTTLDGTTLKLAPTNLVITDSQKVLSLSFIGGQNSGVNLNTTETILEMAIYDRTRVRTDSRTLKIVTEAAVRLEKDLDTDTLPLAFAHLVSIVIQLTGAQISSSLFNYYPQPSEKNAINFDPATPSLVSGIDIPPDFALDCLQRLGCVKSPCLSASGGSKGDLEGFSPPSIRKDITLAEDLVEEVIRFWGYDKIPTNQPLIAKNVPSITPPILFLIDKLKDELITLGYDEVLSWPLVRHCEEPFEKAIYTQNSINYDFPVLRQSIITSLKLQVDQFQRFKLTSPQIFEIGKVFSKNNNEYVENYTLGLYHHNPDQLRRNALQCVPTNGWKFIGNYAEIILDNLQNPKSYLPKNINNDATELTSQIITLDANLTLDTFIDPLKLIKEYYQKIDNTILWQIQITDVYHDSKLNKYRYTFRVSYYNTDDKTAKSVHLKTFNLV